MIKVLGVLALTLMGTTLGLLLSEPQQNPNRPSAQEQATLDSLYQTLSPQERIGQVFMIRAHSDKGEAYERQVARYIEDYQVGGLCFFQGTAARQVALVNQYQSISKTPLLIAMDAEWGPAMRFKEGVVNYPRQWMLGALTDNRILYDFGKEIATQLKSLGVHVNFAPVLDINNNPNNPVINDRSFGEDKNNVLSKGQMYISGMQDAGIMAVGKHFPGHGDTQVDSHHDLPVLPFDTTRLQSLELFPFQMLSLTGMQGIMIAHLHIPALDNTPHLPTTLSRNVVTDLLQKKLQFEGLIFTDAMEMQGVMKHFPAGKAEVMALKAGNDVILLPQNLPLAFRSVEKALESGELDAAEFEQKVKKILLHKMRLGVFKHQPLSAEKAQQTLLSAQAKALKTEIIGKAITLVRDRQALLPLRNMGPRNLTPSSP
jgi:beta-N-acetylhexosaminidase